MKRELFATIAILCWGALPDRFSCDRVSRVRNSLKSNLFNQSDVERLERGYYEQLLDPGQRLDDLADLSRVRFIGRTGSTWSVPVHSAPLVIRVADLREVGLKPGDAIDQRGVRWSTNAQGMRDGAYSSDKPPGTFRIALVGDSIGAGWGVDVEQRFESILEEVWDARSKSRGGPRIEILNCAVPGHSPGQRWYHFNRIGWPMHPDLVIFESTAADVGWDERRLRFLLAQGLGWNSPLYRQALAPLEIKPLWDPDRYRQILQSKHWNTLASVYQTIVADCRARDVPVLWVLIPRVGRKSDAARQQTLLAIARATGFAQVIDATDAYDNMDPSRIAVAAADFHPNPEGHAQLARRLDLALRDLPELKRILDPIHGPARAQFPPESNQSSCTTKRSTLATEHSKALEGVTRR